MPAGKPRPRVHGRRGVVAIVSGGALAVAGAVTLAVGMHTGAPSAGQSAGEFGTTGGFGTSASSGRTAPPLGSSAASAIRHTSRSASALPAPTGNSSRVAIANPAGAQCIPQNLTVSGVGISNEPVVPMGTNSQGQIYPPPHTTMWYDRSAQPGQDGISVIAGHVTYDGPDNFYNLRFARIGSRVSVLCANGKTVNLRVTHTESIPKTELTTDQRVWGGSATPVVTLVTCDLNSPMVSGHHLNNFVVWTKPA